MKAVSPGTERIYEFGLPKIVWGSTSNGRCETQSDLLGYNYSKISTKMSFQTLHVRGREEKQAQLGIQCESYPSKSRAEVFFLY